MDKLFEEFFNNLEETIDEIIIEDEGISSFSPRKKSATELFFTRNALKSIGKHSVNSYFQEELDDNLEDDYVINGIGSLDDDE